MRQRRAGTRLLPALLLWALHVLVRARRTRPEPLPSPPAGSTTVTTDDGTRLHAEVGGDPDAGLTVVMLHGLLARTRELDAQWEHLSPRARLVRYDARGHGRSEPVSGPVDVHRLAADLRDVLATLVPDGPVVLLGHSTGAMTALALADVDPVLVAQRVVGLVLIGAGAGHDLDDHPVENAVRRAARRRVLEPVLAALLALSPLLERVRGRRTLIGRAITRHLLFGSDDADPAVVAMTQEMLEGPPLRTLAALQGSLLRLDLRHVLPGLRGLPVTLVVGEDDRLTRAGHSRRIAADLGPSARLVVVPGAGHAVNHTRAAEVDAAVDELLDRVAATGYRSLRTNDDAASPPTISTHTTAHAR